MQYAGLFSFVTALKIGARLWRDVLARNHGKPCKYCEFATFLMCKSYVFSLHFRRIYSVSIACLSTQSRPDLGSSDGSFSDVAGDRFRMKKSAPRRMMKSAPKHREIGFQETAGFGKTAGCLKNQGFWACRDLPEIRIWERYFPRNVFGTASLGFGNGFGTITCVPLRHLTRQQIRKKTRR